MNYFGFALFVFFVSWLVIPMVRRGYTLKMGFWIGLIAGIVILGVGLNQ